MIGCNEEVLGNCKYVSCSTSFRQLTGLALFRFTFKRLTGLAHFDIGLMLERIGGDRWLAKPSVSVSALASRHHVLWFVHVRSTERHVDCLANPLHILFYCAGIYICGHFGLFGWLERRHFRFFKLYVLLYLLDSLQG